MDFDSSVTRVSTRAGLGAPVLVIAADGGDTWREAAAVTGVRVTTAIGWDAAEAALEVLAERPVLLLETAGADGALLAGALPRIEAYVRSGGAAVAAIGEAQIDLLAAALLTTGTPLLVEPTVAERVAALAIAAERWGAAPAAGSSTHEDEADRLRRLNEEVARIAEVLARLTRGDLPTSTEAPGGLADRRRGFAAQPAEAPAIDAADVRRTIRARRLREQFFPGGLFEDPAWDILLDLFAAELEGTRVSVSSLCIAAAVAPTTALRWIGRMTEAALLVRQPDTADRRRAYMALSDNARGAMRLYLAALERQGLAMV